MKLRHLIFAILAMFAALGPPLASAQDPSPKPWSFNSLVLYDLQSRQSLAVVNTPIKDLTDFFGTKRTLTIGAFAGTGSSGQIVTGFSGLTAFRISNEANLQAGLAWIASDDRKNRLGLFIGISAKT